MPGIYYATYDHTLGSGAGYANPTGGRGAQHFVIPNASDRPYPQVVDGFTYGHNHPDFGMALQETWYYNSDSGVYDQLVKSMQVSNNGETRDTKFIPPDGAGTYRFWAWAGVREYAKFFLSVRDESDNVLHATGDDDIVSSGGPFTRDLSGAEFVTDAEIFSQLVPVELEFPAGVITVRNGPTAGLRSLLSGFAFEKITGGGGGGDTPTIAVNTNTLSFEAVQGGGAPATQQVNITNSGTGTLSGLALGVITYDPVI